MECLRLKSPALSSGVGESWYQANTKYFNITVLHIDPKNSSERTTIRTISRWWTQTDPSTVPPYKPTTTHSYKGDTSQKKTHMASFWQTFHLNVSRNVHFFKFRLKKHQNDDDFTWIHHNVCWSLNQTTILCSARERETQDLSNSRVTTLWDIKTSNCPSRDELSPLHFKRRLEKNWNDINHFY